MATVGLHIVALPYYEVGECLGEFLAEAQGRAISDLKELGYINKEHSKIKGEWQLLK